MKISTKGRYALRMMLNSLCIRVNVRKSTRWPNASRYQTNTWKQIVTILSRAGYVKSMRGAQGGYYLTKEPADYTVGMILRLTEGSLAPVACMEDELNQCAFRPLRYLNRVETAGSGD